MSKESRICYETKDFYVYETDIAFEVYRNGPTHATMKAIIDKNLGLQRAIDRCKKLQTTEDKNEISQRNN